MSEHAPEDLAGLRAELRAELDELHAAQEELREASTARERAAAQEDMQDARGDLNATAAQLGISRSALEHAIAEAKKAERREELGPLVDELVEAKIAAREQAAAEAAEAEAAAAEEAKGKKRAPKVKADENGGQPPDSEPIQEHWSEKRVAEILR